MGLTYDQALFGLKCALFLSEFVVLLYAIPWLSNSKQVYDSLCQDHL